MIMITPEAAKRLKSMLNKAQPNNPEAGIRFGIKSGGCSGYTYLPLAVFPHPAFGDEIFESNGIRVFVDPLHLRFVDGTAINHNGSLLDGGFVFINPNAKTSCGCGISFELKSDATKK